MNPNLFKECFAQTLVLNMFQKLRQPKILLLYYIFCQHEVVTTELDIPSGSFTSPAAVPAQEC